MEMRTPLEERETARSERRGVQVVAVVTSGAAIVLGLSTGSWPLTAVMLLFAVAIALIRGGGGRDA
jgi:hypothetical protein